MTWLYSDPWIWECWGRRTTTVLRIISVLEQQSLPSAAYWLHVWLWCCSVFSQQRINIWTHSEAASWYVWQNMRDVAVGFSYRILPCSLQDFELKFTSASATLAQPCWLQAQLPGCKHSEGSNFCWLQASVYREPEIMTLWFKKHPSVLSGNGT